MNLSSFIFKRFLLSIFVIFGISIIIFVIARVMPGDPVRFSLGARAPEEVVQRLRQEMHLDDPLWKQYYYWIRGALSGDFGISLDTHREISKDIKTYFPATMEMAIFSFILMVVFSTLLGTFTAQHKNTWVDNIIRILSYLGVATPAFVAAIFFVLLFGYFWPILPVFGRLSSGIIPPAKITGLLTFDSLIQGNYVALWDAFKHLILPSVALSLAYLFQEARVTRSSMIDNMHKEFIYAERGYGIPERVIMFKYLLKPSLVPTVSMMGLDFSHLFANAFLVELIFNWPGLSRYGTSAMMSKDLNVISAVVIIVATLIVVINIIVDIIVAFLDPRIRLSTNRGI